MPDHRCPCCELPMDAPGRTGYCSERCLMWSVLGVPALRQDDLAKEVYANSFRDDVPDGWQAPTPYPTLEEYGTWTEARGAIVRAAAHLTPTHSTRTHA